MAECSHLDTVEFLELPDTIAGCRDCLEIGGQWVHLRMCHSCGEIRCCDSSPNRHATKHAAAAGHPLLRSAEPGEAWSWCTIDEIGFTLKAS